MKWLNDWTEEKFLKQIEKKNGWQRVTGKDESFCAFRNDKGFGCIVGAFIPDSKYSSRMERSNNSAQEVIKRFKLEKYMPLDIYDMRDLQNVHDSYKSSHGISFKEHFMEYFNRLKKELH